MILSVCLFSHQTIAAESYAKNIDPTRPFTGKKSSSSVVKKQSKLELQSIIEQGQQRKVIINGTILKKGEHIEGYQVVKISSKNVHLQSSERRLTLSLFTKVLSK
jgi:hypothetical protein